MPVYAFGSNGSGQLGIGHTEDVCVPTRCCFFSTTTAGIDSGSPDKVVDKDGDKNGGDAIRRIAAGGNHTVILYASGAAYAAGMNGDGRCGVADDISCCFSSATKPGPELEDEEQKRLTRFVRVRLELAGGRVVDRFADVSASWSATVFVALGGGEVYVVGTGGKGELGVGEVCQSTAGAEVRVLAGFPPVGTKVTAIASGMSHVVCALSNGDVYGWGAARKGQLGSVATKTVWTPTRIEDVLFRADGVACGREFTVVVSNASGEYVVLGSDKWGIVSGAPSPPINGRVSASWHGVYIHNAADSSLLAWGRNDRGQLPPSSLLPPKKVVQFAAGSEHAVALLSGQRVVSFGWGEHGNCGAVVDAQGNVKDRLNEIPLELAEDERVVGVAAGCATSWAVTTRG